MFSTRGAARLVSRTLLACRRLSTRWPTRAPFTWPVGVIQAPTRPGPRTCAARCTRPNIIFSRITRPEVGEHRHGDCYESH